MGPASFLFAPDALACPPMSLQHDLQYAIELARGAGVILDHYGKVERLTKTHVADHATRPSPTPTAPASGYIVAGLRQRFPNDGIDRRGDRHRRSITVRDARDPTGRIWVIDPIDGTNNFIAGLGRLRRLHRPAGRRACRCSASSTT